jgi:molybdenum cofactor guanylyltransferase
VVVERELGGRDGDAWSKARERWSDLTRPSFGATWPLIFAMSTFEFSAVLLVAGHSTRMGRDKALLEIDGRPLWTRQRDVLAEAGAKEIFLSARPEQTWTYEAAGFTALLHDAMPNSGPLCGVTAGLERASYAHVAVLAVDLPRMESAWFAQLQARCSAGVGAVGKLADGFEPLAAIYPREMKWTAWEALAGGKLSLQQLVRTGSEQGLLNGCDIEPNEAAWLENWNEPR